jgi:hypothetical protein
MQNKKKPSKKRKSVGKAKLRRGRKYSCDNAPTSPMGLREIVKKIVGDKDFATFIRDLLCRSNRGADRAATECLEKFYKSNTSDLGALCIPDEDMAASLRCTEQNRLLDAVAYTYGTSRKR